jgi:mannose-1-phosphate guanylyltransferase
MKGLVLCAGLGTRLRPLTNRWPKPAMPLLAGPLVRYAFATLARAGVTEVAINSFHLPEVMEAVARAEADAAGLPLTANREVGEIQGTGGGIRGLRAFLSGGDFVVLNGDVLFSVDLGPVLAAHRASGAAATMLLLPMPAGETYNAVEVTPEGHVRRIAGKGPGGERLSPWHFSGVHVMSPAVFDFMAPSGPEDINRDVYVRMLERGLVVHGHRLADRDVYWSDLGTSARYAATHQQLLFGQVPLGAFGERGPLGGLPRGEGNFWRHPAAVLEADVKVSGPAWFGEGAVVESGARLGAAVSVGPGARVGRGARLNRVAVLPGASVPAGAVLEDAIYSAEAGAVSTLDAPKC